jgi:hypothetical protein
MCAINSGQLKGWPLSRSTKTAASRALYFFPAGTPAEAGTGGDAVAAVGAATGLAHFAHRGCPVLVLAIYRS